MPASYEVRLNPGVGAPEPVEELAARLRQSPGVADVRYDREWLDRLLSAVTVIRGVGLALSAVLTIAAALTVANVVRLALHARRDEIEIMQLVGAPTAYIRGPFVMEGVLQGGIGAIVALALLARPVRGGQGRSIWRRWRRPLNLASVGFLPLRALRDAAAGRDGRGVYRRAGGRGADLTKVTEFLTPVLGRHYTEWTPQSFSRGPACHAS